MKKGFILGLGTGALGMLLGLAAIDRYILQRGGTVTAGPEKVRTGETVRAVVRGPNGRHTFEERSGL